jgi:hypothetical protein
MLESRMHARSSQFHLISIYLFPRQSNFRANTFAEMSSQQNPNRTLPRRFIYHFPRPALHATQRTSLGGRRRSSHLPVQPVPPISAATYATHRLSLSLFFSSQPQKDMQFPREVHLASWPHWCPKASRPRDPVYARTEKTDSAP